MRYSISLVSYLSAFVALFSAVTVCGQAANAPLSTILNADGSVKRGMTGSFDPSGFRMSHGPNGEPRFVTASPAIQGGCSDSWDTTFPINGADNAVSAVVSDGMGNVYVGGSFSAINGTVASRIAKWNGTTWSALGSGLGGGNVSDIAISGTDVYVGGSFTSAGGSPALHIAKWDGNAWSPMGSGLGTFGNDYVSAIALSGTNVYAGGHFADAGSLNYIARWNGASWISMGTGMNLSVDSLAVSGTDVYAGGTFSMAGGVSVPRVARWDGSSWSAMGTGIGGATPLALAVSGSDLYAGTSTGVFAKWNGTSWDALGAGVGGSFRSIRVLTVLGTDIYVGGDFTTAGGAPANRVARWNGSQWSTLGAGVGSDLLNVVDGIAVLGGTLMVGGSFSTAGGIVAKNIATWNSGTWSAFNGNSLDSDTMAVAVSGTDVYVAGRFTMAGSVTANKIVKWNGSTWSALGSGVVGAGSFVRALAVSGGYLYAAGTFTSIGGVSASGIARWNGSSWSALGTGVTGMNASVYVMTIIDGDVYIGGSFSAAGGVPANRIAKWNGTAWSSLPGSAILATDVAAIAGSGSNLYVGATTNTSDSPNYFLKFDGKNWTGLSAGFGGHGLSSLAVLGSDVYITGAFPSIGGLTVNRIAKWNGSSWSALGSGLPGNSSIVKVVAVGNELIAFGDFTAPANRIARWNGSAWSSLGNGLSGGYPVAVAVSGGNIYAAGAFTVAGCNVSPFFARWRETVWTGMTNTDWHTLTNWGSGSVPGPGAGVTISSTDASITSADVTLSSLVVTGGRTLTIGAGRTLTVTGNVDLSDGTLSGTGNLVVNGELRLNGGTITGLSSIVVNGNLLLNAGYITGTAPVNVTSCRVSAVVGGGSASFIAAPLTRCVNSAGTYVFPVGKGSIYSPVELLNVAGNGNVTVEPKDGPYSNPAPGLPTNRLQRWWQIMNAGITQADVRFYYADTDVLNFENRLRVYRIDGGAASQLPSSIDTALNRATATGVSAFSSFTLAEGAQGLTTLSGRLTNLGGRAASGVITLTDDQNNVRYAVTNPFGYYRFTDVLTFRTYTVRVTSKKFTFAVPQRVVDFDENTGGVNFMSSDN